MPKQEIYLANQEQTRILAAKLAKIVALGDIITLTGNLGAGKTSFVQYLVNSLAEKKIEVTSPSFNLMHLYQVKAFYRNTLHELIHTSFFFHLLENLISHKAL